MLNFVVMNNADSTNAPGGAYDLKI